MNFVPTVSSLDKFWRNQKLSEGRLLQNEAYSSHQLSNEATTPLPLKKLKKINKQNQKKNKLKLKSFKPTESSKRIKLSISKPKTKQRKVVKLFRVKVPARRISPCLINRRIKELDQKDYVKSSICRTYTLYFE